MVVRLASYKKCGVVMVARRPYPQYGSGLTDCMCEVRRLEDDVQERSRRGPGDVRPLVGEGFERFQV